MSPSPQATPPPADPPRRPWWRRPVVVGLLVVALLVLLVLATGVWLVLKRPLTVERWAAVVALEKAGLERTTVPTGAGDLAVWSGGAGAAGGPTLVLLHGAGDHAGAWAEVVGDLATDHRLVVPDLPGHGDSEPAAGTLPMATLLGGVTDLLASEAVRGGPTAAAGGATRSSEAPVVVGNSLGGWLALLVGAQRPELASRLVVVNGGATPGPVEPSVLLPDDREEAAELFELLGAPGPIPGLVLDDVLRRTREGALARFMAAEDHLDHALTGRLAEVAVPVDLVWGELDGYLPPSYARTMANALPAARYTPVDDCGHVPPRYCPQRFTEVLTEVLGAPPPRAQPAPGGADEGGTDGEAAP